MKRFWSCLAVLVLIPWLAVAKEADENEGRPRAELYHTPEERTRAGLGSEIAERITVFGLVEVEAWYEELEFDDGSDDESSSDLVLASAQIGMEAEISDELSALVVLDWEDEEDAVVEIDEAVVEFEWEGWFAVAGWTDVAFGEYPSHFITDSLTTELGEAEETSVEVGYEHEWFEIAVFVFNGDVEKVDEEDHIKDWGAAITVTPCDYFEGGASAISDFADTDAELVEEYVERVGGWSAYAMVGVGSFELLGEVVGALQSFEVEDLDEDEDGSGDRPFAWNTELSWAILDNLELSARLEGSDEFIEEPERQYGVCVSWGPLEGVSVSLEYLRAKYDDSFGDGLDSRHLVTTQFAAEF